MAYGITSIQKILSIESATAFRYAFPAVLGEGIEIPNSNVPNGGQNTFAKLVDLTGNSTPSEIKEIIIGHVLALQLNETNANRPEASFESTDDLVNSIYSAYVRIFKERVQTILEEQQEAFIAIGTIDLDMFDDHIALLDDLKTIYDALGYRMGDALALIQQIVDPDDPPSYREKCDFADQFVEIAEELAPDQQVGSQEALIVDSLIESLELLTHKSLGDDFHHLIDG